MNEKGEKKRQIFAIGLSYSAYVLTHYLGQEGDKLTVPLDGVAVSGASHRLELSFEQVTEKYLFGFLDFYLRQKLHMLLQNNIEVLRDYVFKKTGTDLDKFIAAKRTNRLRDYMHLMG